jgi:hypothetical protein
MTQTNDRTRTFTVRSEADVLALIPYTFGFHPRDSVVMLALTASGRPFHARIDLPLTAEDTAFVVEQLVQPAVTNEALRVLLVAYTDDERRAAGCLAALEGGLAAHDVETVMALRADGTRWCHVDELGDRGEPTAYDVTTHALTTEGVLEGKVTYETREELRESVALTDPERARELTAHHRRLPPLTRTQRTVLGSEGRWLLRQVADHLARGEPFDPVTAARVVRALDVPALRDLAWCRMTRSAAEDHVRLWRPLVQACPDELAASPASVLAFAAWLSGHGALAWCAVDRALQADPGHTLARLVSDMLDAALPPARWEPFDPCALAVQAR